MLLHPGITGLAEFAVELMLVVGFHFGKAVARAGEGE